MLNLFFNDNEQLNNFNIDFVIESQAVIESHRTHISIPTIPGNIIII